MVGFHGNGMRFSPPKCVARFGRGNLLKNQWSNEEKGPWLFSVYIGDYTVLPNHIKGL